jgi:hypothetical protein
MDAIYDRYARVRVPVRDDFATDLAAIQDVCRWTNGFWDFGPGQQRKWNELQNTTRDIQLLTSYLLLEYKNRVTLDTVIRPYDLKMGRVLLTSLTRDWLS